MKSSEIDIFLFACVSARVVGFMEKDFMENFWHQTYVEWSKIYFL